mgnify:FL=1
MFLSADLIAAALRTWGMMQLKPWYDVLKPREDLRVGKPHDTSVPLGSSHCISQKKEFDTDTNGMWNILLVLFDEKAN